MSPATQLFAPADLPLDWRTHVTKQVRSFVRHDVDEDPEHKRILDALPGPVIHQPDIGCYHVHTHALTQVEHKGLYRTASGGTDYSEPNAFLFLLPGGALRVVRFESCEEDDLWDKTANGWPTILYNVDPCTQDAAAAIGATRIKGGFTCHNWEQAEKAAQLFGVTLPPFPDSRPFTPINFLVGRDDITIETARKGDEQSDGWGIAYRKFQIIIERQRDAADYKDVGRHVVQRNGSGTRQVGWQFQDGSGNLVYADKATVITVVATVNDESPALVTTRLAQDPYFVVCKPLKPAGEREINTGVQLVGQPSSEPGPCPSWDSVTERAGRTLTRYLTPEMRGWGLESGGDWLALRAFKKLQDPEQPLPNAANCSYAQDTGKSIANYRAFGTLFPDGAVDIRRALTSDFNSPLEGALLGYVNEQLLDKRFAPAFKELTDEEFIWINHKFARPYPVKNYMMLSQTANEWLCFSHIPANDERWTLWLLRPIPSGEMIDWHNALRPALIREMPFFLQKALSFELPKKAFRNSRLWLPVVPTPYKHFVAGNCEGPYPILDHVIDMVVDPLFIGPIKQFYAAMKFEPRHVPLEQVLPALERGQRELEKFGITISVTKKHDILTVRKAT